MDITLELKEKILDGYLINKTEAIKLINEPLDKLCSSANEIRKYFCGNDFDICTIINAKSGKCSENCKYCAQSSLAKTNIQECSLLGENKIIKEIRYNENKGVLRCSIVASGRSLKNNDIDKLCKATEIFKGENRISLCASLGLLNKNQFKKLKGAGIIRIHNNLETSKSYFPFICSTHSYEDKLNSIKSALSAGLEVCSGGLMGIGETMEDRIDMIIDIRNLGIRSIPINMLNPISGTPFENYKILDNDTMCRIIAIFRFLVPDAFIRLAGGRALLPDKGKKCFMSGANATISGDMLTTAGISLNTDIKMIENLGFKIKNL